jgi:hypothetical protein
MGPNGRKEGDEGLFQAEASNGIMSDIMNIDRSLSHHRFYGFAGAS